MEVIWGVLEMKEMGEGSTGCCGALLFGKAFGRDGILWTLFSHSGSDSVSLKDLSGGAEAIGQAEIEDYWGNPQTMEGHQEH